MKSTLTLRQMPSGCTCQRRPSNLCHQVKSQIYKIIRPLTWFETKTELVHVIHVPISDRKVAVIGGNYLYLVLTENGTMCTSNGLQQGNPTYPTFESLQVKIDQLELGRQARPGRQTGICLYRPVPAEGQKNSWGHRLTATAITYQGRHLNNK
jgi:hypothetical protein